MLQDAEISIGLNSDTFILADSQELAERLHAETDLRVKSHLASYASIEGFPPPDVVLNILYTLAPLLADVYLNVVSSALYDAMKAAFSRQGKPDSEATFYLARRDDVGNVVREVRGQTSDREIIKGLIRQASEDDET